MAGIYFGAGGVARKVKNAYIGVNSVARKVKNGYIGVAGVARKFFVGIEVAFHTVSSTDYITVNSCRVGANGDTWEIYLNATGVTSKDEEAVVPNIWITGDILGKTITFEYTNDKYDANYWVVECNNIDSSGNLLNRLLLEKTSTWTSASLEIPTNSKRVSFSIWFESRKATYSGTLKLRNVKINGKSIM